MARYRMAAAVAVAMLSSGASVIGIGVGHGVTTVHALAATPACSYLYYDAGNDGPDNSKGVASGSQQPNLDIIEGDFGLTPDGKTLRAVLTLANQDFSFATTGPGIDYQMVFQFGTTNGQPNLYATDASLTNAGGAIQQEFTFGLFEGVSTSQTGLVSTQYVPFAQDTVAGKFTSGVGGTVEVDVPLADITVAGSTPPTTGDTLTNTQGYTASGQGNQGVGEEWISDADPSTSGTSSPHGTVGNSYTVGQTTCLTPASLNIPSQCTDIWVGGNGDWSTAADWSTGVVPGTSDTACLMATTATTPHAQADTYAVTLNTSASIQGLYIGSPHVGPQRLVIAGGASLTLNASSFIYDTGVLSLGNGANPPAQLTGTGSLLNYGLVNTSTCATCSESISVSFDNAPNPFGTLDIGNNVGFASIFNSGRVRLQATTQNFGQLAGGSGSSFTNDAGGELFEQINATSNYFGRLGGTGSHVVLGGTLDTITLGGSPPSGSTWPVIAASSLTGTFDAYQWDTFVYTPQYSSTGLTLVVPTAQTPEVWLAPMVPVVGGLAVLGGLRLRRRR